MSGSVGPSERFALRNPMAVLGHPLFIVPWTLFPLAGALLVWFTREDLERSAFYWVFFGGFQVIWTWATWKQTRDSVDPEKNFAELATDELRIHLAGAQMKLRLNEIRTAERRSTGAGLWQSLSWMGRLPRGPHVEVRLKRRAWRLLFWGGSLTSVPIDVVETDRFLAVLDERLRGR